MDVRAWLIVMAGLAACHHAEPRGQQTPATPASTPAAAEIEGSDPQNSPTEPELGLMAPIASPAAEQAHGVTQQRLLGKPLDDDPRVQYTPIEDPSGRALDPFHTALRDLATHLEDPAAPPRKVRVALYGSSSVAIDVYPAYLRSYLQERFGDAGIGFVAAVPLWKWHRHDAVHVRASRHWKIEHAQRKVGKLDGDYGLLGASAHTSSAGAWTQLTAAPASFSRADRSDLVELHYLAQPGGGRFRVEIAGKVKATVGTDANERQTIAMALDPALVPRTGPFPLRLQTLGDGEVRLFGAVFERDAPGIVVDALGVGGTRAANILAWQDRVWRDPIQRRDPALYVLAYGANEAIDEDEPIETYAANLEQVLERFAVALPRASCVLVGPVDFRRPDEHGVWEPRPRIQAIIETQRRLAFAHGCGFWDSRASMGGEGGMNAWAEQEPALAKADHLHPTTLGYLYMGRALVDALMAGYDAEANRVSAAPARH